VWDAKAGQVLTGSFAGHTNSVYCVAFSPDGQRIASASEDWTIRVWDGTTGQLVAGPFSEHTGRVYSVAFSPDGQHIASASSNCTICVWDATTGQVIMGPFTGHTDAVFSVAFSPDGQHIASASEDCTVRVWDATIGHVIDTDPVVSLAFSPDGKQIVSPSGMCAAHVDGIKEDMDKIRFTDQTLIDGDGWIYEDGKGLLLWIPVLHRSCLHRPSTLWIAGDHETRLDLSNFVHGSNWATVHDHNFVRCNFYKNNSCPLTLFEQG
jgi:WD40 repeat protein